ncbi:MAG: cysteine desulfurase family protein [Verrucomicrobiales bacterium]|nr:cysteine desulfurase family protein [Verrucomicrobiales bacterium]
MSLIFLDNNATTAPLPEVVDAMAHSLRNCWGNPSSNSNSGDEARKGLFAAREHIARLLKVEPECIIFTSGGTEANNLAFRLALRSAPVSRKRVILSGTEHASILELQQSLEEQGYQVAVVEAYPSGRIQLEKFRELADQSTALVSVQWVNNETGIIQPIEQIREICANRGICFHSDVSQAVGKIPFTTNLPVADFTSLTAHKFHGPKGIGAVTLPGPPSARLAASSLFYGGQQESGIRPGTENLACIVGFGEAARIREHRLSDAVIHMANLRDQFERGLLQRHPEIQINGDPENRICNTSNLRFPGISGEALVNALDLCGIECSQSSACTTARPEPSHVLTSMGLTEDQAYSSVRFSFSVMNTMDEVERALELVDKNYMKILNPTLSFAS